MSKSKTSLFTSQRDYLKYVTLSIIVSVRHKTFRKYNPLENKRR